MAGEGLSFNTIKQGVHILLDTPQVVLNIVGHAGIGKTQVVETVAREQGYFFREITCSLLQEGDIAMPVQDTQAEAEGRMARVKYILHTALVEILEYHEQNPEGKSILFLDEYNRASSSVQAEWMNLVLQRRVMGVELPENCRVILAENPSTDVDGFEGTDYHVNIRDGAINDRTMRIRMGVNLDEWISDYAKRVVDESGKTHIHPLVTRFLAEGNREFFLDTTSEGDKKPTPRAWERVSNFLYAMEAKGFTYQNDEMYGFLREGVLGSVGSDVGKLFNNFAVAALDYIAPSDFLNANGTDFKGLMSKFKQLQEVRRSMIAEDFVRYMALDNHKDLLTDTHAIDRLVDVILDLNEDTQHVIMYDLFEHQEGRKQAKDFLDYTALRKALVNNSRYEDKEFEITIKSHQIEQAIR